MENVQLLSLVSFAGLILFIAYISAALTDFLYDCMEDGMIFDHYGAWVQKEVRHNRKVEQDIENTGASMLTTIPVPKWKKPIGACMRCSTTWMAIAITTSVYWGADVNTTTVVTTYICVVAAANNMLNKVV